MFRVINKIDVRGEQSNPHIINLHDIIKYKNVEKLKALKEIKELIIQTEYGSIKEQIARLESKLKYLKRTKQDFTPYEHHYISLINSETKCADIEQAKQYINDYDLLKKSLESIQVHNVSCVTKKEYQNNPTYKYNPSGYIVLDIDHLEGEKEILQVVGFFKPKCSAIMLTPSFHGLKVFFKFENLEKYDHLTFKNIYTTFAQNIENQIVNDLDLYIDIDEKTKDTSRISFIGLMKYINDNEIIYNADDYYNENLLNDEQNETVNNNDYTLDNNAITINKDVNTTINKVNTLCKKLKEKNIRIANRYDDMLKLTFAFIDYSYSCNVNKQEAFERLKDVLLIGQTNDMFTSTTGNEYNFFEKYENEYNNYTPHTTNVTIGTFFHFCKENNVNYYTTFDEQHSATIEVIKQYLNDNNYFIATCKYSYNKLICDNLENKYVVADIDWLYSLYTYFNEYSINYITYKDEKVKKENEIVIETVKKSTITKIKNTIFKQNATDWKAYITQIISNNKVDTSKFFWDNISKNKVDLNYPNYTAFENIFLTKCKGDKEFNKLKLKAFMYAVINKSFGKKEDYCMVLVSKEGIGKTCFIREFFAKLFGENQLVTKITLSENEWVCLDYLPTSFISEIDEKVVGINQNNLLKNIVSTNEFQIKAKHSNNVHTKTSRSSIIFSTNDYCFINADDEYNRRFFVFDVIDKLYEIENNKPVSIFQSVDYVQLWNEMYHYYKHNPAPQINLETLKKENDNYKQRVSFTDKKNTVLNYLTNNILDNHNGIEQYVSAKDLKIILDIYDITTNKDDLNKIQTLISCYESKNTKNTFFSFENYNFDDFTAWNNKRNMRYKVKLKKEVIENVNNAIPTIEKNILFAN